MRLANWREGHEREGDDGGGGVQLEQRAETAECEESVEVVVSGGAAFASLLSWNSVRVTRKLDWNELSRNSGESLKRRRVIKHRWKKSRRSLGRTSHERI